MDFRPEFTKLADGLYLLKAPFSQIWSGVFFVDGKEKVLIDSGASADAVDNYVIPALAALGHKLSDIDWLVNTHAHGDHMGGNGRILEVSGRAKLAAAAACVDKMENPLVYNRATRAVFPEYSPAPAKSLPAYHPDRVLSDGELLTERVQLFYGPGHDTECVLILDKETGSLITGDSIQAFGTLGADGAGLGFYKSVKDYSATLEKARSLNCENLFASHDFAPFGYCARGREEVKRYLDVSAQALEIYDYLLRRMLREGMTDIAEMAHRILRELGTEEPPYLFMTMFTVQAHLKHIKGED